jgi:hypothetical protein
MPGMYKSNRTPNNGAKPEKSPLISALSGRRNIRPKHYNYNGFLKLLEVAGKTNIGFPALSLTEAVNT